MHQYELQKNITGVCVRVCVWIYCDWGCVSHWEEMLWNLTVADRNDPWTTLPGTWLWKELRAESAPGSERMRRTMRFSSSPIILFSGMLSRESNGVGFSVQLPAMMFLQQTTAWTGTLATVEWENSSGLLCVGQIISQMFSSPLKRTRIRAFTSHLVHSDPFLQAQYIQTPLHPI